MNIIPTSSRGTWSQEEHQRFLRAMELYPRGPWKDIANYIATRTVRQTQTHAQKYREKMARRAMWRLPSSPQPCPTSDQSDTDSVHSLSSQEATISLPDLDFLMQLYEDVAKECPLDLIIEPHFS